MDCIKYLHSYDEIKQIVSKVRQRRIFDTSRLEHYRGQGRPEYKLLPNIARVYTDPDIIKIREEDLISKFIAKLREKNIEQILRIDPNLNEAKNLWNILIQSQHFGVPTRFLDWSLKWEVGLWFTVENPKNDNVDGQFWVFSVPNEIHCTDTRDNYYEKDVTNLNRTYFINAPIYLCDELQGHVAEIKRQRQHGKFTVSPYQTSIIPLEEQEEIAPHLEKFGIPAETKGQIRLELTSKGIHNEWLYYREYGNEIIDKIVKSLN